MIIQTRALSGGVVLPACPYGGCGGACPSCARVLASQQYAPAMRGFGAFGATSFTTPERECDVGYYDRLPDGWQQWCDCMFAPTDPNRAKCRKRPCGNPVDPDPDCVFGVANPNLAWAPWTDIGAGVRGIPKRGGGLIYLFSSGFAPVEPEELEPDYFFSLIINNPLRATYVIAHHREGLFKAKQRNFSYGAQGPGLAAMFFALELLTAGYLQNIPLVGGFITTPIAVAMFASAGLITWPIVLPAAWAYSIQKDPSGARTERFVFGPVFNALGDILQLVSALVTALAGDPEGLAKLIAVLCRRAAALLPATGATDVEVARALLNAAAKASSQIVKIVKDPKTAFTTTGTYAQIGGTLKDIATVAAGAGNKPLADTLLILGDTFQKLDPSLTAAALAIATGDTQRYLCCGPDTAYDLLTVNYLGFKISALVEIASNLAKAGATASAELGQAAFGSQNAKNGMQALQDGLNALTIFAQEVDKALAAIGVIGQFFTKNVEKLVAEKAKLDAIADSVRSGTPVEALLGSAPGVAMKLRLMSGQRGGFRFVRPPLGQFAESGPSLAPVLLGAGAGFLVGGPPGALIGGGALLLANK